ncbi:F-box protein At3g07870-like [Bidens hawaiensis]|uniref:F-box protein At3g07870-like n=1 Tax=Bidens hawaiensis TaxID=980011 RepID=UPI00404AE6F5
MKRKRKGSVGKQAPSKRTKVDFFTSLHDDIVLDIFQKLPADILRYKTRFVCKRWFSLITDRVLRDHASFLLENTGGSSAVRLMDISEHKQGLALKDQPLELQYTGRTKSWCNEFLLITDLNKQGTLYVYNIISKKGLFLPPCSTSCGGHYGCKCGVGLSYDKFKGVYKVVHVFWGPQIQCELLILKGDIASCSSLAWKKIAGPYYTGQRRYYWDDPVSVQGRYFHWDVHCNKYLVSMDTVKERFRQTRLPVSDVFPMNKRYFLVEMGGFLSLLHNVTFDKINIWMLKDYQRSKWENMQSISTSSYLCSSIYPGFVLPFPVTCVRSKRYIIFRKPGPESGLYSYDLKDKVMRRLDVDIKPGERCVVRTIVAAGSFEIKA